MTISQEEKLQILNEEPQYEFMGNEAMFEQNVVDNLDQICEAMNLAPIKQIFRQERIVIDKFHARPDIIIRHEDETRTIIEVKKVNNKYPSTGTSNQMNAIGQLLLYGNVFRAKSGIEARLMLIDCKIFYRTYCAFLNYNLPIALVEFQKDRLFVPYNGWRG